MKKPKLNMYGNILKDLDSLKGSRLFTQERWSEITAYVADDKFGPVILENGKAVPEWFCHKETGLMWGDWFKTQKSFVRSNVLEIFLEVEEIERLNKYANGIWSKERDKERFDKAEKVSMDVWDKPVYYGDDYYVSVEDFIDLRVECEGEELPEFVWGVDGVSPILNLDADSIIENATEEAHENFSASDLDGLAEFKDAVKIFNERNKDQVNWICNEKIAVLLK